MLVGSLCPNEEWGGGGGEGGGGAAVLCRCDGWTVKAEGFVGLLTCIHTIVACQLGLWSLAPELAVLLAPCQHCCAAAIPLLHTLSVAQSGVSSECSLHLCGCFTRSYVVNSSF